MPPILRRTCVPSLANGTWSEHLCLQSLCWIARLPSPASCLALPGLLNGGPPCALGNAYSLCSNLLVIALSKQGFVQGPRRFDDPQVRPLMCGHHRVDSLTRGPCKPPPPSPCPQAVRMSAVVRMPACHSRRFKGERPIGTATG